MHCGGSRPAAATALHLDALERFEVVLHHIFLEVIPFDPAARDRSHLRAGIGIAEQPHDGAGELGWLADFGDDSGVAEAVAGESSNQFAAGADVGAHTRAPRARSPRGWRTACPRSRCSARSRRSRAKMWAASTVPTKSALIADAEAAGELDARVEVGRFLFGRFGDEELGVGNISGNGGCRSEQ